MPNVDLQNIESRPQRYWNVDGLPEIVMGGLWILWGLAFLIPDLFSKGGWLSVYWTVVPLILAFSGFAANWLTKRLKAHWTFPRTGYVEWKKPKMEHNLAATLLAVVVAAALALGIALSIFTKYEELAAPAMGLLFATAFLVAGRRSQLPNLVWLAATSLILGGALYPLHLGMQAMPWFLIGVGAVTAIAGAWRLTIFLKANPAEAA